MRGADYKKRERRIIMTDIEKDAYLVASELLEKANEGEILVVGCSSSEVMGEK